MIHQFDDVLSSVSNEVLRGRINNHFLRKLSEAEEATKKEIREAVGATVKRFPELIEYFIRLKEERGDLAVSISGQRLRAAEQLFIENVRSLASLLFQWTGFYRAPGNTKDEARVRVAYLKDVIENKGGWQVFYVRGKPVHREDQLQLVFRFTWRGTPSDVSREVDDGRGPADYKISRGAFDKTIVEFKLARNTKLKRNLQKQAEIYQSASDADAALKVILLFYGSGTGQSGGHSRRAGSLRTSGRVSDRWPTQAFGFLRVTSKRPSYMDERAGRPRRACLVIRA